MSVYEKISRGSVKNHTRATVPLNILLEHAPTWGNLALFVEHQDAESSDLGDGRTAPAWTNGRSIWYSPDFDQFTQEEKVGVVVHELLHCALRHSQRAVQLAKTSDKFNFLLWNIATDAVINHTILTYIRQSGGGNKWIGLPKAGVNFDNLLKEYKDWRKEQGLAEIDLPAPSRWSAEQVYHLLVEWQEQMPQQQLQVQMGADGDPMSGDLEPDDGGSGDSDQDRSKSTREERLNKAVRRPLSPEEQRAVDDATRQWRERLERAQAGDNPGGILRGIDGDMPDVRTPWEVLLRTPIAKAVLPCSHVTPERPSRRYIVHTNGGRHPERFSYEPAVRHQKPGARVAIGIDTSGSINAELLRRFAAEIQSICRKTRSEMIIIVCDAAVQEVHKVRAGGWDDATKNVAFKGGGGTDFRPFITEALKHDPNIIVHLTDLMGQFPERGPRGVPVIWAVPEGFGNQAQAPFGKVVQLF